MRAEIRLPGVASRLLAGALFLGLGVVSPVFGQTQLTCAQIGGTCRTLEEGPASGEILDNSGSCAYEGGPTKKCYAPAVCDERGGACQPGVTSCSSGTTQLGNGQCSSGRCCTPPTTGPTCGALLGHPNGFCSPYSDTCPSGYVNRGPTMDPCLSCCELATAPPPLPPPPAGGSEYKVEYLHTDALGSVRMVTDQAGAVVSRRDYYPFGEGIGSDVNGRQAISANYSENPTLRQQFTGKERDGESQLDYFGARYYASAQGRFTTPDLPFADQHVGDPQSWNLYAYARNSPLVFVDPTGREIELIGDDLTGAYEAIKAALGRAAADRLRVRTRDGRTFVEYTGSAKDFRMAGGELGAYFQMTIDRKDSAIQVRITDDFETTGGKHTTAAFGGAATIDSNESLTGSTQVLLSPEAASMATSAMSSILGRARSEDGTPLWYNTGIVTAHEFGHAFGNMMWGMRVKASHETDALALRFEELAATTAGRRGRRVRH